MAHDERLKDIPVIMLTGQADPATIRRCHDLLTYYVAKSDDVWPRLEPLLRDLLKLASAAPSPTARQTNRFPVLPAERGSQQFMNAVFAALGCDEQFLADGDDGSPGDTLVAPTRRPWVLCIDDDAAFSFGLKLRLEEHGVAVLRAFAGMEGYRTAFLSPAQAIILDYEMPNGNGDYVLRRLRETAVTRDIPVIVLTGHHEEILERKMYSMGASSFMTKPYNWPKLWSTLQRHLHLDPVVAG